MPQHRSLGWQMNSVESLIWSAHAGGFAMLILFSIGMASIHRTVSAAQQVLWLTLCGLTVLSLNGLLPALVSDMTPADHRALRVFVGPTCSAVSAAGLRSWLGIQRRHHRIDMALMGTAGLSVLVGLACLALPDDLQLQTSIEATLAGLFLLIGLCGWAAMLGDRFALPMTFAIAGLFAVMSLQGALALDLLQETRFHAWAAVGNLCCMLAISVLLWLRSQREHETQLGQSASTTHDMATGMYNGKTIIRKILTAQRRLRLRVGEGAVLAVMVINPETLEPQIGRSGIHEVLIRAGARVRREAGLVNPVGRYFDRCFIVLLETVRAPEDVQHMTLTLTHALAQPIVVRGAHGESQSVVLNIGVGSARLTYQSDIAAVLHRAQEAARSAASARSGLNSLV